MNHKTKNNLCTCGVIGLLMCVAGCAQHVNPPPIALDQTPIPVDSAMAIRQWDESKASYQRMGVMAESDLLTFSSAEPDTSSTWMGRYGWAHSSWYKSSESFAPAITETPLFLLNILASPYAMYRDWPFWVPREYRIGTIAPSYSAMPALPPTQTTEQSTPAPEAQPTNEPAPAPEPTTQPG